MIEDKMKKIVLKILDMDCLSCAQKIEYVLKKTEGIKNASVSFPLEKAEIEFEEEKIDEERKIKIEKGEDYQTIPGKGIMAKYNQKEILVGNRALIEEEKLRSKILKRTLEN